MSGDWESSQGWIVTSVPGSGLPDGSVRLEGGGQSWEKGGQESPFRVTDCIGQAVWDSCIPAEQSILRFLALHVLWPFALPGCSGDRNCDLYLQASITSPSVRDWPSTDGQYSLCCTPHATNKMALIVQYSQGTCPGGLA